LNLSQKEKIATSNYFFSCTNDGILFAIKTTGKIMEFLT